MAKTLHHLAFVCRGRAGHPLAYRELGAVDVIPKPFDPIALPERVLEIWRQAQKVAAAS